jgi:RNA polymerase sigma-70 factor, ECF subfamily
MDSAARLLTNSPSSDSVASVFSWTTTAEAAHESSVDPHVRRSELFASVVRENQRLIYGYLRARILSVADVEDLCQEVFLRSYVGLEKLTRSTSVPGWLLGIARNVLREHSRKMSRRREVAWTELCLELDALVQSEHAMESDLLQHLPACLDALGPSAREAIDLRYKTSLNMEALAKHFRRSEGAVKLLMHRARTALRNCLERKLQPEKTTP